MKYFDELKRTMTWVGQQNRTFFLGQATATYGTFMSKTLDDVDLSKRLEFPVCESLQMQFTLGIALQGGIIPISVFPRWNFLLLATGDLVNMVDKVYSISRGQIKPHLIVRVAIGPDSPVHPGHQHVGDFTEQFRVMLPNVVVTKLEEPYQIFDAYKYAVENPDTYLMVEDGRYYSTK